MGRGAAGDAVHYARMPGHGPGDDSGSEKFLVAPASCRCGAQVENLCHQRWRGRNARPTMLFMI